MSLPIINDSIFRPPSLDAPYYYFKRGNESDNLWTQENENAFESKMKEAFDNTERLRKINDRLANRNKEIISQQNLLERMYDTEVNAEQNFISSFIKTAEQINDENIKKEIIDLFERKDWGILDKKMQEIMYSKKIVSNLNSEKIDDILEKLEKSERELAHFIKENRYEEPPKEENESEQKGLYKKEIIELIKTNPKYRKEKIFTNFSKKLRDDISRIIANNDNQEIKEMEKRFDTNYESVMNFLGERQALLNEISELLKAETRTLNTLNSEKAKETQAAQKNAERLKKKLDTIRSSITAKRKRFNNIMNDKNKKIVSLTTVTEQGDKLGLIGELLSIALSPFKAYGVGGAGKATDVIHTNIKINYNSKLQEAVEQVDYIRESEYLALKKMLSSELKVSINRLINKGPTTDKDKQIIEKLRGLFLIHESTKNYKASVNISKSIAFGPELNSFSSFLDRIIPYTQQLGFDKEIVEKSLVFLSMNQSSNDLNGGRVPFVIPDAKDGISQVFSSLEHLSPALLFSDYDAIIKNQYKELQNIEFGGVIHIFKQGTQYSLLSEIISNLMKNKFGEKKDGKDKTIKFVLTTKDYTKEYKTKDWEKNRDARTYKPRIIIG